MADAPDPQTMTLQQVADAVAAGMMAKDRAARSMGLCITSVGPGRAQLQMTVRDDMLNGFDICHGGFITTLADTAFAYACNSTNELTVAAGLAIDFIAPARAADVLTASAREVALAGRSGIYDVEVRNQRDEIVAVFRGRSHRSRSRTAISLAAPG
jgi:acyl-CoA thioesterase